MGIGKRNSEGAAPHPAGHPAGIGDVPCAGAGCNSQQRSSHALHHDPVTRPKHYTSHPSGIECIQVTEHMSFNIGNVIKYVWRADEKGAALEDLRKAAWYLQREIEKRERAGAGA